jgi:D-aminoacyl-tRNA deacylase
MLFHTLRTNTLLVATTIDPASVNIAHALINRSIWKEHNQNIFQSIYGANTVFLWLQDTSLLRLNYVDDLFRQTSLIEHQFDDVIFLSKHSAASGIASLTVHPIGIPWSSDIVRSGGLPGRCSPPSFRISSLLQSLSKKVIEQGVSDKYQV